MNYLGFTPFIQGSHSWMATIRNLANKQKWFKIDSVEFSEVFSLLHGCSSGLFIIIDIIEFLEKFIEHRNKWLEWHTLSIPTKYNYQYSEGSHREHGLSLNQLQQKKEEGKKKVAFYRKWMWVFETPIIFHNNTKAAWKIEKW